MLFTQACLEESRALERKASDEKKALDGSIAALQQQIASQKLSASKVEKNNIRLLFSFLNYLTQVMLLTSLLFLS